MQPDDAYDAVVVLGGNGLGTRRGMKGNHFVGRKRRNVIGRNYAIVEHFGPHSASKASRYRRAANCERAYSNMLTWWSYRIKPLIVIEDTVEAMYNA